MLDAKPYIPPDKTEIERVADAQTLQDMLYTSFLTTEHF